MGRLQAAPDQERVEGDDRGDARVAELLADAREDEVGVVLGEEAELLPTCAEADAPAAAGADRDQALVDLIGVLAGDEVEEARAAVADADDLMPDQRRGQHDRGEDVGEAGAGDVEGREREPAEEDGRPEVLLQEHQEHRQRGDEDDREEAVDEAADPLALLGEGRREEHREGDLGDLARLDVDPEAEPAAGAVDLGADQEHGDEADEADQHQVSGVAAEDPVVDPGDREHHPEADQGEDPLAAEEVLPVAVVGLRGVDPSAVDHDYAEAGEGRRGDEEPRIHRPIEGGVLGRDRGRGGATVDRRGSARPRGARIAGPVGDEGALEDGHGARQDSTSAPMTARNGPNQGGAVGLGRAETTAERARRSPKSGLAL